MKPAPIIVRAIILLAFTSIAFAVDPFPDQPAMSSAFHQLTMALKSIEKGRSAKPAKHLQDALSHLDNAKGAIELGAKNKGTYGPTARGLIDQAKKELEAKPSDATHVDQAVAFIKKALDEITKAARAGRR